MGTRCLSFPSLEPLGAGSAQPMPHGKQNFPCGSPPVGHRVPAAVPAAPVGSQQPRGWALHTLSPLSVVPKGARSCTELLGCVGTLSPPCPGGLRSSRRRWRFSRAGKHDQGPRLSPPRSLSAGTPCSGQLSPAPPHVLVGKDCPCPKDVRRRKGWGAAQPRSCFRRLSHSTVQPWGWLRGCLGHTATPRAPSRAPQTPNGAQRGRNTPDAWVTPVPQFPQQTARPRSSSGQPQVMHKGVRCSSFGDPNPPSSTPQSPDTRVPTTRPHTAWLLLALVWGLINFWGKRGALVGALRPPGGAAALPECFPSANTGASASPTALH